MNNNGSPVVFSLILLIINVVVTGVVHGERTITTTTINQTLNGVFGIDVSLVSCESGISLDSWKCLRNNGFSFAIIEVWNGGHRYNTNMKKCVNDAWGVGMDHVDVYAFLCPNCRGNNPPEQAIVTILNNLERDGVKFGQFWFDIEQCKGCWNDIASNAAFVRAAVNKAVQLLGPQRVGIYSSKYEWQNTVGSESSFSHLAQWYAHWDNIPNFSDPSASQFGGWTHPAMKQYNDHGPNCSVDVDVDWYPSSQLQKGRNLTEKH